jgi:hypothetical protein
VGPAVSLQRITHIGLWAIRCYNYDNRAAIPAIYLDFNQAGFDALDSGRTNPTADTLGVTKTRPNGAANRQLSKAAV